MFLAIRMKKFSGSKVTKVTSYGCKTSLYETLTSPQKIWMSFKCREKFIVTIRQLK